jgi:hypothetical protein
VPLVRLKRDKVKAGKGSCERERFALTGTAFAGLASLAGQLSALSTDARSVLTLHLAATSDAAGSSGGAGTAPAAASTPAVGLRRNRAQAELSSGDGSSGGSSGGGIADGTAMSE